MSDPRALLRDGLLDATTVLVAPAASVARADLCARAGAAVVGLAGELLAEDLNAPAADVLVVDAARLFGDGGADNLRLALDCAWSAVHSHFDAERATKIVLVSPRPCAGVHAEALRASVENMARTLSVEWARFGIRTTAVLPGDDTLDAEVAQVIAFLASPAGDYFSGCRLELGAAPARNVAG